MTYYKHLFLDHQLVAVHHQFKLVPASLQVTHLLNSASSHRPHQLVLSIDGVKQRQHLQPTTANNEPAITANTTHRKISYLLAMKLNCRVLATPVTLSLTILISAGHKTINYYDNCCTLISVSVVDRSSMTAMCIQTATTSLCIYFAISVFCTHKSVSVDDETFFKIHYNSQVDHLQYWSEIFVLL